MLDVADDLTLATSELWICKNVIVDLDEKNKYIRRVGGRKLYTFLTDSQGALEPTGAWDRRLVKSSTVTSSVPAGPTRGNRKPMYLYYLCTGALAHVA